MKKRIISLVLALAMLAALGVTSFAANDELNTTINNDVKYSNVISSEEIEKAFPNIDTTINKYANSKNINTVPFSMYKNSEKVNHIENTSILVNNKVVDYSLSVLDDGSYIVARYNSNQGLGGSWNNGTISAVRIYGFNNYNVTIGNISYNTPKTGFSGNIPQFGVTAILTFDAFGGSSISTSNIYLYSSRKYQTSSAPAYATYTMTGFSITAYVQGGEWWLV